MERIMSELPPEAYRAALKSKFDFSRGFGEERVTGVLAGRFFSLAYYSGWEWNRRITNECNRAFGYIRDTEGKTEVVFLRGKGQLSISWLLLLTLVLRGIFLLTLVAREISLSGYGAGRILWLISALIALGICCATAFGSLITERGQEGAGTVTKLLRAPDDFYC